VTYLKVVDLRHDESMITDIDHVVCIGLSNYNYIYIYIYCNVI
jgi:hypothetical protein